MDSSTIRAILDKYWEGEASLTEEDLLRDYFSQDNVPKEFESIKPMFQFFKQEQEAYLNGDFDERLSSKLKAVDPQVPRRHSLTFYIRRVAAVAAIFAGVLFFFQSEFFKMDDPALTEITDTERKEAKVAYTEAKAALLLISSKLNKGTDKAESGIIQVKKATNIIKN